MRTTLTIEDALAEALKKQAHETGRPFKAVVNDALRAGLARTTTEPLKRPYRIEPASMGQPRPGVDLEKGLQLAGMLEDEELARKLDMRK